MLPAFLEKIDTKDPNTIIQQALVLLEGSLPPGGQTTGVGQLHLVFPRYDRGRYQVHLRVQSSEP